MPDVEQNTLSDGDIAFLTKTLWEALLAPKWTKDDLIDFGKAIFTKRSLREMDDKTFEKVFPFLKQVSVVVGQRLSERGEQLAKAAVEERQKEKGVTKTSSEEVKAPSGSKPPHSTAVAEARPSAVVETKTAESEGG